MTTEKSLILDSRQVKQKIKRMAFEIYENRFKEKSLVLAGIDGQGYVLAKLLCRKLQGSSPITVHLSRVTLDKLAPQRIDVTVDTDLKTFKKKSIVLVDDVLNTGRTFAYGLKPFLRIEVK